MKILFIGPHKASSKYNYQSIKKIYKNTDLLDTQKIKFNKIQHYFYQHINPKIFNNKIDFFYKDKIKKKYDIIFINNESLITKKTFLYIKKYSKKILYFCGDNPFIKRDNLRWKNLNESFSLIDLIIFHINSRKIYAKKFKINNYLLTLPPYYKKIHLNNIKLRKKKNIVFIGTWFPERGKFFYELKKLGLDFDIYGSRWEKDKKYYSFLKENIKKTLKYEETVKIIKNYKINLGLLSKENKDDITRRCIEIPAVGSLLCCQRTNTLKKILKENKEAIYFSNSKECYKKCVYLLKNDHKIKDISIKGNIKVRKKLKLESENIFKKILNFNLIRNKKKLILKY